MKYKCSICGFIHEGPMPDGYICPLCHSGSFYFKLIKDEEAVFNRVIIDPNNPSIARIEELCVNCGMCTKTCEEKVGLHHDSNSELCINCGQCILTCPRGALVPKYDYKEVLNYINNPEYIVCIMTSPAVRVGIGDAFGFAPGTFLEGKMVSALKSIGFDYVFDTTFGADLTSIEEANELNERITNNKNLPMYSSCCPSWIKYVKLFHNELRNNISTCKSPIEMEATIIKKYYAKEEEIDSKKLIIVALTPCTSKKMEIIHSDCDYVITTSELALMLKELSIDFKNLKDEDYDDLKGTSSGTIFGTSGGVSISVLRNIYHMLTERDLKDEDIAIINKKFYKEYKVKAGKRIIKCASLYTMPNLEAFLNIANDYDFIEVMNCQNGCVGGGGQILMPIGEAEQINKKRRKSLMNSDEHPPIKYAYKNEMIKNIYSEFLTEEKRKKLLHYN